MADRLSRDDWSEYWRKATITTFAREFNENYDYEFRLFWDAQFQRLGDGAHVLDVATGNGAIALLVAEFAEWAGKSFRITATDYADIRPPDDLAGVESVRKHLPQIDFHGGTPMEATGLADASADLITSQYGFEYGDRDGALTEFARVLKSGGRAAMVLHHDQSLVVRQARDAVEQTKLILQREKLDERAERLIRAMGDPRTPEDFQRLKVNAKSEAARKKLNAAVERINSEADSFLDPDGFISTFIGALMEVFVTHRTASQADKLAYVRRLRADTDSFRVRMADLMSAALTESDFDALVDALEAGPFTVVEKDTIQYKGRDLMGWTLVAERS